VGLGKFLNRGGAKWIRDSLYVTVFEGSKDADQLEQDTEALDLWSKIVDKDKILFWTKKDTIFGNGTIRGPCGTLVSKIHVDFVPLKKSKVPSASLVRPRSRPK